MENTFKALRVHLNEDKKANLTVEDIGFSSLPNHPVLIRVSHSSLNYKDALSASGNRGVTKNYPHTPGIDAVGTVVSDTTNTYPVGQRVLITGYDLGMNTPGGFGQYIAVPTEWCLRMPPQLTEADIMSAGTAGFTAMKSVMTLQNNQQPAGSRILVTGATGGVGSWAIAILSALGYHPIAATRNPIKNSQYLTQLGAAAVISATQLSQPNPKPMTRPKWDGAIDAVGGQVLTNIIKACAFGGTVTTCGNVAGATLDLTVFPFILNNITLAGIASADTPPKQKKAVWQQLFKLLNSNMIKPDTQTVRLEQMPEKIKEILNGTIQGRVILQH